MLTVSDHQPARRHRTDCPISRAWTRCSGTDEAALARERVAAQAQGEAVPPSEPQDRAHDVEGDEGQDAADDREEVEHREDAGGDEEDTEEDRLPAEEDRGDDAPGRDGEEVPLRLGLGRPLGLVAPVGVLLGADLLDADLPDQAQDPLAHVLGLRQAEVGDLDVRVPAPGRLDTDLGEAREPGEQRTDEVDGLDAVVGHLPERPEDRPAAHLEALVAEAVPGEPPRQDGEEDHAEDRHRDEPDLDEGEVTAGRAPFAAVREVAHRADDAVDLLGDEVAEDTEHDEPAPDEGGQRMDPDEALEVVGRARGGHSPARCASPCAESRTRSSSATSTGRPGRSPLLAGEAVLTEMSAIPFRRL